MAGFHQSQTNQVVSKGQVAAREVVVGGGKVEAREVEEAREEKGVVAATWTTDANQKDWRPRV